MAMFDEMLKIDENKAYAFENVVLQMQMLILLFSNCPEQEQVKNEEVLAFLNSWDDTLREMFENRRIRQKLGFSKREKELIAASSS